MILYLYHKTHQDPFHPVIQFLYQSQVHPLIQFNILATYPQCIHMHFLLLILLVILALYPHMYQVGIHLELQLLLQAVSHIIIILHYHHLYQSWFHWGIQINHLSTSLQGCLLKILQLILQTILALYHHRYQVRAHPYLQVLCQSLSHHIIQSYYQNLYQAQFHIGIQVKNLATSPQIFHLYFLQLIILVILDLYHHMYQVWIRLELRLKNGKISVFSTWFGWRKFGRLEIGSKINSRTKDSGCSCNLRI